MEARRGDLISYQWSSLVAYAQGQGPDRLVMERLLNAFELAKDGRGRRAYVLWLEKRAANEGGKVDEAAVKALRRGWYLRDPKFLDQLRKWGQSSHFNNRLVVIPGIRYKSSWLDRFVSNTQALATTSWHAAMVGRSFLRILMTGRFSLLGWERFAPAEGGGFMRGR